MTTSNIRISDRLDNHDNDIELIKLTNESLAIALERLVFEVTNSIKTTEDFKKQTLKTIKSLNREMKDFKDEMKDFKDEMKDFKDEMKDFKDEMKDFKDEMKDFKDEMKDFKDEMKDFKDEMKEFKDEMKDFKDEMKDITDNLGRDMKDSKEYLNKEYGKLSKKLGTFVEDIFAPNIPYIAEKFFELTDFDRLIITDKRKHPISRDTREFDVVALYGEIVILNETKATMRTEDIRNFAKFIDQRTFFEYYPEYEGYELIPILSSFKLDESMVKYMSKNGIYAMALDGGFATLLNFESLNKKQ